MRCVEGLAIKALVALAVFLATLALNPLTWTQHADAQTGGGVVLQAPELLRAKRRDAALVTLLGHGRDLLSDIQDASLTGDEVTVPSERLVEAAVDFANDACAYLLSIVPFMVEHGSWHKWCAGMTRGV
jgi:hypothetical protein